MNFERRGVIIIIGLHGRSVEGRVNSDGAYSTNLFAIDNEEVLS